MKVGDIVIRHQGSLLHAYKVTEVVSDSHFRAEHAWCSDGKKRMTFEGADRLQRLYQVIDNGRTLEEFKENYPEFFI